MQKEELLALIQKADKAYYELSAPIMTDAEYDTLRAQYIRDYGPDDLNYVPSDVSVFKADFTHPHEVISLDKVKAGDNASLQNWLSKKAGDISFLPVQIQKKEDGCTVVFYKSEDKLMMVSRGDGIKGKILNNIPEKYNTYFQSEWPVRCEAIFKKSVFDAIQKERAEQELEPFKNIRNAVSGVIQSKDKSPYLDRVSCVAYDLMGCPLSEGEKLEYIRTHTPFEVIESYHTDDSKAVIEHLPILFEQWQQEDDPIDGVVVKCDAPGSLAAFGSTGHHPLNAFAYKAAQEAAVTTLRSIEWQVGRERITAVAHFDPVEIDDTTVSKASVSNIGIIRKLNLSIGVLITVIKSNQIIPMITSVIKDGDTPIEAPKVCPECGQPLFEQNDVLFCTNNSCKARFLQNMDHLASKHVLDIRGLSESTIAKLMELGLVKDLFDIFSLTKEDFLKLPNFGEKSASNLYAAIHQALENVDLPHFIAACCTPKIGVTLGTLLAGRFGSYEALLDALENPSYDFSQIDGIGEVTNQLLHSDSFISAYRRLRTYITPKISEAAPKSVNGTTYSFVITGKLSQPRSYYEDLIRKAGHTVAGSVSKNTNYLLCEDPNSQSTKAKKARSLGVKVISEKELSSVLKND